MRFIGFEFDGPLSAGSDGYCPTSEEKPDPGTILSSGTGELIDALSSGKQRNLGKCWRWRDIVEIAGRMC